jgi:hypothetical protein
MGTALLSSLGMLSTYLTKSCGGWEEVCGVGFGVGSEVGDTVGSAVTNARVALT